MKKKRKLKKRKIKIEDEWRMISSEEIGHIQTNDSFMWQGRVKRAEYLTDTITSSVKFCVCVAFPLQVMAFIFLFIKEILPLTIGSFFKYLLILCASGIGYLLLYWSAALICHLILSTEIYFAHQCTKNYENKETPNNE